MDLPDADRRSGGSGGHDELNHHKLWQKRLDDKNQDAIAKGWKRGVCLFSGGVGRTMSGDLEVRH